VEETIVFQFSTRSFGDSFLYFSALTPDLLQQRLNKSPSEARKATHEDHWELSRFLTEFSRCFHLRYDDANRGDRTWSDSHNGHRSLVRNKGNILERPNSRCLDFEWGSPKNHSSPLSKSASCSSLFQESMRLKPRSVEKKVEPIGIMKQFCLHRGWKIAQIPRVSPQGAIQSDEIFALKQR
jgi:hypothetical protein